MPERGPQWTSRAGFILASLGMAFGAGNIWRFPRVVAANGGGPFLIAFIIANLVWAVPLLMIEMAMGKSTRLGTVGAFRDFVGRKRTWMGAWVGACAVLIMAYYSVVTGWAMRYLAFGAAGTIRPGLDSEALWRGFLASPLETVAFHLLAIIIAGAIIIRGVQKGLEKACTIIVPGIIVILFVVMAWGLSRPGAVRGLEFLFRPDLGGLLRAKTWLNAFSQAAWSVGAGWGLMLTYAVYLKPRDDIAANSFIIAFADSGSSLLSAMAILPLVFAVSPSAEAANAALQAGDTGLTFIYLTRFFPTLPAGSFIGALFFLALSISALASLLSMVELAVRNLEDTGLTRRKAAAITVAGGFLLGLPSALRISFQENQDMVWGVGLLISGMFFAYAAYKKGLDDVRGLINDGSYIAVGRWFNACVLAMPVIFTVIFGWWVGQAAAWYPRTWWNPLKTLSPGTMVVQWAVLLTVLILANNRLAGRIKAPHPEAEGHKVISNP